MLDIDVMRQILGEPAHHGRVVTPRPDSRYILTWLCGCVARGVEDDRAAVQLCRDHASPE